MSFTPTGSSSSESTPQFNEGLALFVTFAILFLLSVWSATAKFAFIVAISLAALVWIQVFTTPAGKSFWQALSR